MTCGGKTGRGKTGEDTPSVTLPSASQLDQIDDYLLRDMCQNPIDRGQFGTLSKLISTHKRVHRVCQPLLRQYCEQVKQQPPTIENYDMKVWMNSNGQHHRDCDRPAVIRSDGTRERYLHDTRIK